MTQFEVLNKQELTYGKRNFIEVARKKVNDSELISISKGFIAPDGSKRFKNSVGFPANETQIREFVVKALQEI